MNNERHQWGWSEKLAWCERWLGSMRTQGDCPFTVYLGQGAASPPLTYMTLFWMLLLVLTVEHKLWFWGLLLSTLGCPCSNVQSSASLTMCRPSSGKQHVCLSLRMFLLSCESPPPLSHLSTGTWSLAQSWDVLPSWMIGPFLLQLGSPAGCNS